MLRHESRMIVLLFLLVAACGDDDRSRGDGGMPDQPDAQIAFSCEDALRSVPDATELLQSIDVARPMTEDDRITMAIALAIISNATTSGEIPTDDTVVQLFEEAKVISDAYARVVEVELGCSMGSGAVGSITQHLAPAVPNCEDSCVPDVKRIIKSLTMSAFDVLSGLKIEPIVNTVMNGISVKLSLRELKSTVPVHDADSFLSKVGAGLGLVATGAALIGATPVATAAGILAGGISVGLTAGVVHDEAKASLVCVRSKKENCSFCSTDADCKGPMSECDSVAGEYRVQRETCIDGACKAHVTDISVCEGPNAVCDNDGVLHCLE